MTLPAEILDEIFMIVALNSPPVLGSLDPRDLGWTALPLVCRDWKRIIYGRKSLWAAVHGFNPSTIPRALALSGELPVVYLHTAARPKSKPSLDAKLLIAALRNFEPRRYRSITVDRGNAAVGHMQALVGCSQTAPLEDLEELVMRWDQKAGDGGGLEWARYA